MSNLIKQLKFQQLACQHIPSHREVPSIEVRERRLSLDLEESTELAEAFGMGHQYALMLQQKTEQLLKKYPSDEVLRYNEREVLDALIDKEVINNGSIIETGMLNLYDHNYTLVYENNMTKCCDSPAIAEESIQFYRRNDVACSYRKVITEQGIKYVIIRTDGKLLKPINFLPVKLNLEL